MARGKEKYEEKNHRFCSLRHAPCALLASRSAAGEESPTDRVSAEGKFDRHPELAAELVRLKVDIIVVAGGAIPVRAAKNATKTIPIVMVGPGIDPVAAGFVESLARPGGNVTGITLLTRKLDGKRLELLKEAVPKVPVSLCSTIRPSRTVYSM